MICYHLIIRKQPERFPKSDGHAKSKNKLILRGCSYDVKAGVKAKKDQRINGKSKKIFGFASTFARCEWTLNDPVTRMHSSRMRTSVAVTISWGGGLPQCMLGYTPLVWAWRPPWPDPSTSTWVWAWRPARHAGIPPVDRQTCVKT